MKASKKRSEKRSLPIAFEFWEAVVLPLESWVGGEKLVELEEEMGGGGSFLNIVGPQKTRTTWGPGFVLNTEVL